MCRCVLFNDMSADYVRDIVFNTVGLPPSVLNGARTHRWLGLLWDVSLNLLPCLQQKIIMAGARVASLAGHVASQSIPLALALETWVPGAPIGGTPTIAPGS